MRLEAAELAGVVDLFGALTREELATAVAELAFRQGVEFEESAHESAVAAAIADYVLVEVDVASVGSEALVVGPAAFPAVPEHGQDLPHIVSIEPRSVERAAIGEQVEQRLRREAAQAVAEDDTERVETLLDASYELEAWSPVEVGEVRERLTAALEET